MSAPTAEGLAVEHLNTALGALLDALQSSSNSNSHALEEAWKSSREAFEACRTVLGPDADPADFGPDVAPGLRRALRLHAVAVSVIENEHTALLRRLDQSRSTRNFLRSHRAQPRPSGESCDVSG